MNALRKALDSKLGRKLRGVSVVDNKANPLSALNLNKAKASPSYQSPRNKQYEKDMNAAYKNDKVLGTPLR